MKKILAYGIVAIVVLAAIGWLVFQPADDGMNEQMVATIHIESEDGEEWVADVPLGKPNFAEQMMLAFGQGIREVPLLQLPGDGGGSTPVGPTVWRDGVNYRIWADVKFVVVGDGVQSLSRVDVKFTGLAGTWDTGTTPDHATDDDKLVAKNTAGEWVQFVDVSKASGLTLDTEITISQDSATTNENDRFFNTRRMPEGSYGDYLHGSQVDGSVITVSVTVTGVSTDGTPLTATSTSSLKIVCSAYNTGSMSVVITGMTSGGV